MLLALLGCGGAAAPGSPAAAPPDAPAAPMTVAPSPAKTADALRDFALARMRSTDLTPMSSHYGNWMNGGYYPWMDYLVGTISATQYAATAPAGYKFNDVYGFNLPAANFTATGGDCYFSDNFIHPLAARYYWTHDAKAIAKWLAVTRDIAQNERAQIALLTPKDLSQRNCMDIASGNAGNLLNYAFYSSASWSALAAMAKSAGQLPAPPASGWSSDALLPVNAPLTDAVRAQFPSQTISDIAAGVARNFAPDLVKFYSNGYAPNQRLAGLGSVATLTYFFEPQPDVATLIPRVDAALAGLVGDLAHLDGGMLEQSFNYSEGTIEDMRRLSHFNSPRPWIGAMRTAIDGYGLQKAALATPTGGWPQMGNTVWGDGKPADAVRFGATSIAFPYSGYYVQRSAWTRDASYLFFFARRATSGHSMAGSNSVQIGAFGHRLVIAGGSPNYTGVNRAYPRSLDYLAEGSSYKTSTILVDGKSQAGGSTQGLRLDGVTGKPNAAQVPLTPVASRWLASDGFDFVEGLYDAGYRAFPAGSDTSLVSDVTHWRGVVFVRDLDTWIIVDILRSPAAHEYTQVWKLAAPSKTSPQLEGFDATQVSLAAAERRIVTTNTTGGATNVSFRQFGPSMKYTSYFGADGGPYGYVGLSWNDSLAFSNDVHAKFSGSGNQVVITVIRPFAAPGNDGVSAALDETAGTISGATLTINGTRLSIRASALPATLRAADQSADAAQLLVVEASAQGPSRKLVIGELKIPASSYATSANGTLPIVVPSGFHWSSDANGARVPVYTP